jgi:hypothetical protein
MLLGLRVLHLGFALLGATLCYASPAPDPQSKLLNLSFSGVCLSPSLDCVRDALGKCNPPPPKIHKCLPQLVCNVNSTFHDCCGPYQTCTATGCVGPIDCTAGVCGDECCPAPPDDYCAKACGTDCCTQDPKEVGLWTCPSSPIPICCPSLYGDMAVLDSNNQNPICCPIPDGWPDGYYGPLINCGGNCCEGQQCVRVTGAADGPYLTCPSIAAQCTISLPCRSDSDCVGWDDSNPVTCVSPGCCSNPTLNLV